MSRSCFAIFVFCFILDDVSGSNVNSKFDAIIENMTECQNPLPPFTKNRLMLIDYKIHKNKGKTYLSGQSKVFTEVPFQNFSVSTYTVDDYGRQELKMQAQKLNCRSFVSKLFLEYGNFRYVRSNCRLLKGSFTFKDFDIDKVLHKVPNWHSTGRLLYRIALTLTGKTVFCIEIMASVKEGGCHSTQNKQQKA